MAVESLQRLRGRIGAYAQKARHDPAEMTAAARATFLGRFELEVDPDMRLAPADRARRAEAARKAYFARLALRSAEVRQSRSAKRGGQRPENDESAAHDRALVRRSPPDGHLPVRTAE